VGFQLRAQCRSQPSSSPSSKPSLNPGRSRASWRRLAGLRLRGHSSSGSLKARERHDPRERESRSFPGRTGQGHRAARVLRALRQVGSSILHSAEAREPRVIRHPHRATVARYDAVFALDDTLSRAMTPRSAPSTSSLHAHVFPPLNVVRELTTADDLGERIGDLGRPSTSAWAYWPEACRAAPGRWGWPGTVSPYPGPRPIAAHSYPRSRYINHPSPVVFGHAERAALAFISLYRRLNTHLSK